MGLFGLSGASDVCSAFMQFQVTPTRHEGVMLTPEARAPLTVKGILFVEERQDFHLRRATTIASINDPRSMFVLLPQLFDARVTQVSEKLVTMRGWERIRLEPDKVSPWRECVQSWVLVPMNDEIVRHSVRE